MPIQIKENISLAPLSIYKIGGSARFFIEARGEDELKLALDFVREKKIPFFILGAGSNILVSDRGYEGAVIRLTGGQAILEGERLIADADMMMASAASLAARSGLAGFEWAIGIPGTVGGSVRGNAGCFGGEIKDAVESVRVFEFRIQNSEFRIFELTNGGCEFSYRDSIFKRRPEWVILSVAFLLRKGDILEIQERVRAISRERSEKQDIGTKSAGCIFKNVAWDDLDADISELLTRFPELKEFSERAHIPASFLLDRAGLKGRRVGRIFVSSSHANFFVNEGDGTAEEVKKLIDTAKEDVFDKYGIKLEEEIQYVGF